MLAFLQICVFSILACQSSLDRGCFCFPPSQGKAMYQNCCRRKRGRQQIYSGAGGRANTKEQVAPLGCFESLNTYKDEKYQFFLKAHHFLSSDTIPTCGERITAVENTVAGMLFWLKKFFLFFSFLPQAWDTGDTRRP